MTRKHPPEDEIKRLAEHYEQLGDEDLLAEWERGAPVTIDVGKHQVLAAGMLGCRRVLQARSAVPAGALLTGAGIPSLRVDPCHPNSTPERVVGPTAAARAASRA